jgi:membrane-associated protein
MDQIIESFRWLYSPAGLTTIIQTVGILGLTVIVFSETGLLLGFFLPGDSLLVTAGILACPQAVGGGLFDPFVLIGCLVAAAILGDQVNYGLGRKTGDVVFSRPDGRLVKRKHFEDARDFYQARGGSAILLARFVPILRTFVPFVAGVAQMPYRRFVAFNMVGGTLWVVSMVLIGYFLGSTPLAKNLHGVIVVVVFISVLPLVFAALKQWWSGRSRVRPTKVVPERPCANSGLVRVLSAPSRSSCNE